MKTLVDLPEYALIDQMPTYRGSQEPHESSSNSNLFAIAWRSRWLILLSVLLGGAASWALLEREVSWYTSSSRIYVERNMPRLLETDFGPAHSGNYLNTQAEIIRSTSVLSAALDQPEVQQLTTIRESENPLGLLRQYVSVSVGQNDDIINISAELTNPTDAAQVVNSIVDSYISKYAEDRRSDVVDILNILRNEKVRRDQEYKDCLKRLEEFRRQHSSLYVQVGEGNVVNQRFSLLAKQLDQTEIALLEAKARYGRVQKMFESPSQRLFIYEQATGASTSLRDANLETEVSQMEQELAVKLAQWGEGNRRAKQLKDTLDELKKRLAIQREDIIEGYIDSLRQECELIEHKRKELQTAYDAQFQLATEVGSQTLTLKSLHEELAKAEKNTALIDQRIKEINLTEEVGAMNVSIMEVAQPGYQSYPQRSKFLGMGVILGGMVGFALAWLRDLLDHRLRSIEEISELLQLPVLGSLPLLVGNNDRKVVGQIVANAPHCAAAEAVRSLRTSLHFGLGGTDVKTLAVTSPSSGDGKSTVASNMAIAMSQIGHTVLLIEADMRKPSQSETFEIVTDKGLSTVLDEGIEPGAAICSTDCPSLDLMPCGKVAVNPAELLNSRCFVELLEDLREKYDKIIIDSPPVIPLADARGISAVCDCTLLVLRAECSTRRLSLAARDELRQVRAQRLAVIVNGVPMKKPSYGYGYGYSQIAYGGDTAIAANGKSDLSVSNGSVPKSRAKMHRLSAPES